MLDKVSSLIMLVVLLPLLIFIYFYNRIFYGRPSIFTQSRVGRHGKMFTIYKFRTMSNPVFKSNTEFSPGNKTRVTKFGKFLRKSKFDEFPQLFNVLKGDMALVGPRPEVKKWVDEFPEEWKEILKVKPGITDPASILFRNEEELLSKSDDPEEFYRENVLPKKIEIYKQYIKNKSTMGDLKILILTIMAIFK